MWLPTGFGKCVCYEVLPLTLDKTLDRDNSLVFIVLPLISLMVDQVRSLCVSEGLYVLLKDIHS